MKIITSKTISYQVIDASGTVLDCFLSKKKAAASAFSFALEYSNDTFYVLKKSLKKEKIILTIKIDAKFSVLDALNIYEGLEETASNKKKKIQGSHRKEGWRP